jgi:hypothetical protein
MTGCGGAAGWHRNGVSVQNTNNVISQCEYEMGMNKVSASERKQLLTHCMQRQGFRYY